MKGRKLKVINGRTSKVVKKRTIGIRDHFKEGKEKEGKECGCGSPQIQQIPELMISLRNECDGYPPKTVLNALLITSAFIAKEIFEEIAEKLKVSKISQEDFRKELTEGFEQALKNNFDEE